jgi:hypothetical protein
MHPVTAATTVAGVIILLISSACRENSMSTTESNKAFITKMLSEKKRLEDFPDRFDPNLVMYEPAMLPFGGTYRGLEQSQRFYPDVFATTRVGSHQTKSSRWHIC